MWQNPNNVNSTAEEISLQSNLSHWVNFAVQYIFLSLREVISLIPLTFEVNHHLTESNNNNLCSQSLFAKWKGTPKMHIMK